MLRTTDDRLQEDVDDDVHPTYLDLMFIVIHVKFSHKPAGNGVMCYSWSVCQTKSEELG